MCMLASRCQVLLYIRASKSSSDNSSYYSWAMSYCAQDNCATSLSLLGLLIKRNRCLHWRLHCEAFGIYVTRIDKRSKHKVIMHRRSLSRMTAQCGWRRRPAAERSRLPPAKEVALKVAKTAFLLEQYGCMVEL